VNLLDVIDGTDELLTPRDVAKLLGVSEDTLKRWRQSRCRLPYTKAGRRVLYSASDVLELLKQGFVAPRHSGAVRQLEPERREARPERHS